MGTQIYQTDGKTLATKVGTKQSVFLRGMSLSQSSFWRTYFLPRLTGTFVLRLLAVVLGLVINAVLSNLLGASGYGLFAYAFSIIYLLALLGGMGSQQLMIREVSRYRAAQQWGFLRGLLQWSSWLILGASVLLGILFFAITYLVSWPIEYSTRIGLWIALLALPFMALVPHRQGALSGLHRIVWGQLPDQLIRPLVLLLWVGGFYVMQGSISAEMAITGNVIAMAIGFLIGTVLLLRALPSTLGDYPAEQESKRWLRSGLAFLVLGGVSMINSQADLIMLGSMGDVADAGIYNVPLRLVVFLYFLYALAEQVLAPVAAEEGVDMKQLQKVFRQAGRLVWGLTVVGALLLIFLRDPVLRIFGSEFVTGGTTLIILSCGAILHLAFGFSGYLLMMRGYEGFTATVFGIGAAINIVLNLILIPRYGLEGAASATVIAELVWRIGLYIGTRRKLGISVAVI